MKNIRKKFKFHPLTSLFLLVALCSGFFKPILLILLIVVVHEFGHVLMIWHYEYEIIDVTIYPFGGITKVNKPINTPLKKEVLIALAGVLMQCVLYGFFFLFYYFQCIYPHTFQLFCTYNKVILLFNLLPIIPLDGSILMHSLLEYFFPYQKASIFYFLFSLFSFFLFVTYHTLHSLNNYMIVMFLFFKMLDFYRKRKFYQNKFYLERYLYDFPYTKIESHSYPDLQRLKKDTLHFFWISDRYLHEKEFLKQRFSK